MDFVPVDFVVPTPPATGRFVLEPLGPQHNESDYHAWASSMELIRSLPGWASSSWPHPMSLEDNMADLEAYAAGFEERTEFTYTVLDPESDEVVGCVYIKPARPARPGAAEVRSWVRAGRAELDKPLYDAVTAWLAESWPFREVTYAVH